jgi:type III pantothenate kinase
MNPLYLDIGNSNLKLAGESRGEWKIVFEGAISSVNNLVYQLQKGENFSEIIVSSVREDVANQLKKSDLQQNVSIIRVDDIPQKYLNYDTPETLGLDRFFSCLGAAALSKKNVIVVDAGTACTVDFMTSDKVFEGGVILPGLRITQQAMKNELPELPVPDENIPDLWPGKSTVECIQWGLYGGFIAAIQSYIGRYKAEYRDVSLYITGGEAGIIQTLLGSELELIHHKFLVFEGMKEFVRSKPG